GVAALVDEVDPGAGDLRYAGYDFAHPLFNAFAHVRHEGANGDAQLGGLRDHVTRVAGLKLADRNDGRLQRIDTARHDRLQPGDDLANAQYRIDADMRA